MQSGAVDFLALPCRGEKVVGPGSLGTFIICQVTIVNISVVFIHLVYLLITYLFPLSFRSLGNLG